MRPGCWAVRNGLYYDDYNYHRLSYNLIKHKHILIIRNTFVYYIILIFISFSWGTLLLYEIKS